MVYLASEMDSLMTSFALPIDAVINDVVAVVLLEIEEVMNLRLLALLKTKSS